jgi:hypothetical protein
MASVFVVYDVRSGQIITMHHGAIDRAKVERSAKDDTQISSGYLSVIEIPTETLKAEVRYKVDVTRKVLVQSAKGERGSGSLSGKSSSVKN